MDDTVAGDRHGDPPPLGATGPQPRAGLRERLRRTDAYGLVFVLILLSLLLDAAVPPATWSAVLAVALRCGTLLLALRTSEARPVTLRAATGAVGLILLTAVAGAAAYPDLVTGAVGLAIETALVAAALVAIGRRIVRYPRIDVRTMLGALCIYLLLGMFFASLFATVADLQSGPFFVQGEGTRTDYLYFAYVTLTTVGYGDLTAAENLGRMLSVVGALTGQLYLVTVVALIVSNIGRTPPRRRSRRGDVDHDPPQP